MITVQQNKSVVTADFDIALAIVQSLKYNPKGLIQEPLLAPSKSLFFRYRNWVAEGIWNKQTFDNAYAPQFLRELKANQSTIDKLNEIYRQSKQGLNISLSCFCEEESLCHRSIIAGLLQGAGADVNAENNYISYWHAFKQL